MSGVPDDRHGAASHHPENMARWWGMRPTGMAHGLSAALWELRSRTPMEIASPPDPETNIVSGSVASEMSLDGRTLYRRTVPGGTFNLVHAGERPRAILDWADCSILHIYLPAATVQRAANDFFNRGVSPIELAIETDLSIKALADSIVREMRDPEPGSRLMIDGMASQLTALMVRRWSNHSKQASRNQGRFRTARSDWRVRRALEFMESRLSDDFGLDEVANSVGLSSGHFAAVFRRATSMPPHRWLVRKRIAHACEMLVDPRHSVTSIAHACGFASSQHLATVFRKQMGTTPTSYRRIMLS